MKMYDRLKFICFTLWTVGLSLYLVLHLLGSLLVVLIVGWMGHELFGWLADGLSVLLIGMALPLLFLNVKKANNVFNSAAEKKAQFTPSRSNIVSVANSVSKQKTGPKAVVLDLKSYQRKVNP